MALSEPVGRYMSTPPIVVRPDTRISEAAGIMLLRKIHRLPVVDEAGRLVGCVSLRLAACVRLAVCPGCSAAAADAAAAAGAAGNVTGGQRS